MTLRMYGSWFFFAVSVLLACMIVFYSYCLELEVRDWMVQLMFWSLGAAFFLHS